MHAEGQPPRGQTLGVMEVGSKRMLGPPCCGDILGTGGSQGDLPIKGTVSPQAGHLP